MRSSFVEITNSTFSANSTNGDSGGAVLIFAIQGGSITLTNSIIGDSGGGGNCVGSLINDGGSNFADDGTCGPGFAHITPGLDFDTELADNGGPTLTHALLPFSVAIDAASDCGLDTDQRGFPRDDGACDSGSFEFGVIQDDEDEDDDEGDDRRNGGRRFRLFRDSWRTPSDRIRGLEPR